MLGDGVIESTEHDWRRGYWLYRACLETGLLTLQGMLETGLGALLSVCSIQTLTGWANNNLDAVYVGSFVYWLESWSIACTEGQLCLCYSYIPHHLIRSSLQKPCLGFQTFCTPRWWCSVANFAYMPLLCVQLAPTALDPAWSQWGWRERKDSWCCPPLHGEVKLYKSKAMDCVPLGVGAQGSRALFVTLFWSNFVLW